MTVLDALAMAYDSLEERVNDDFICVAPLPPTMPTVPDETKTLTDSIASGQNGLQSSLRDVKVIHLYVYLPL